MKGKKSISYIPAVFFCLFTIGMFFMIGAQFFIKNILIDRMRMKNVITDLCVTGWGTEYEQVDVDWQQLYPYGEADALGQAEQDVTAENAQKDDYIGLYDKVEQKINTYKAKFLSLKNNITDYSSDFLPFGIALQSVSGAFDSFIGNRMVDAQNFFFYTDNGGVVVRSPFASEEVTEDGEITQIASDIENLDSYLCAADIPFLYVQTPVKENKYDEAYVQKYGENAYNQNADRLLYHLGQKQISYLDLRQSLFEDEKDFYSMFYLGDGHWNVHGGLWATDVISAYLAQNCDMNYMPEYLQEDKYESVLYENWYMGVDGHEVTLANLPREDFELLLPAFETNYHLNIPTLDGIVTDGSFEEVMFDYGALREKSYYVNPGGAYLYSKPPLIQLQNTTKTVANKGKRVLLLRDSFGAVVIPYLTTQYEYVDAIVPEKFDGNLKDYIQQTKPDVVIMMYSGYGIENWHKIW